jgi:hypothetical protein
LPSGANWPFFSNDVQTAATVDPMELPQLWNNGEPVGFLADQRARMIAAMRDRYVELLADVTLNAFDVDVLHAELDRLRTVMHSTERTDDATIADLQTFDDHIGLTYDFIEQRKAYLLTQLP